MIRHPASSFNIDNKSFCVSVATKLKELSLISWPSNTDASGWSIRPATNLKHQYFTTWKQRVKRTPLKHLKYLKQNKFIYQLPNMIFLEKKSLHLHISLICDSFFNLQLLQCQNLLYEKKTKKTIIHWVYSPTLNKIRQRLEPFLSKSLPCS